ncbi:MAG: hypothetical protein HN919_12750 [Verrucomicrobia bacterium]|jgi:hypothetical protein|nr:hypothetical protein [Verrucomicrobiota bacterium]
MNTTTRITNSWTLAAVAIAIVGMTIGSARADVLYFDNFSGASNATLTGTAPSVQPGSEVWSGNSNGDFRADGTYDATPDYNGGVWLPFVPEAGNVYTLSADVSDTGGGGPWTTLSYSAENEDRYAAGGVDVYGLFLYRNTPGGQDVVSYLGRGLHTADTHAVAAGALALKVVLDATDLDSASWTMEFFINDTQVRVPTIAGQGDYGEIKYVGFTTYTSKGTIANFALSTPPPKGMVLVVR